MGINIEYFEKLIQSASPLPWKFESWKERKSSGPDIDLDENGRPESAWTAHIAECDVLEPTGIQHVNDYEGYWHDWHLILEAVNNLPALLKELDRYKQLADKAYPNGPSNVCSNPHVFDTDGPPPSCDICYPDTSKMMKMIHKINENLLKQIKEKKS